MWIGRRIALPGAVFGIVMFLITMIIISDWIVYPDLAFASSAGQASQSNPPPQPPIGIAQSEKKPGSPASFPNSQPGECTLSSKFPKAILQWCETITHYSIIHKLDPNLVASIIWQESGGNPSAYSNNGAVGLMQVMPSDGLAASFQCGSGPCFSNRPTTKQLMDPQYNVEYGTRMLSNLVSQHRNVREALKSYGPINAGYYYADKVLNLFQNYGQ